MNRGIGVIVCTLIAALSYGMSHLPMLPFTWQQESITSHPIEPMMIAIVLGVLVSTLVHQRNVRTASVSAVNGVVSSTSLLADWAPGVQWSIKVLLPTGIVFMGAHFNLLTIIHISLHALVINLLCIIAAYFLTQQIGRWLKLDPTMNALITIGTAICGSSAIVAAAPVVKSTSAQTAMAMTVISLYGLLGLFCFPLLGHAMHLSDWQYGIWSGTVIQAVPQVVAAGFAFSVTAGQVATIVKMVRILLLGPMTVLIGMQYHREQGQSLGPWYHYFPLFILFFIAMVIINTLGGIDTVGTWISLPLSSWLSVTSMSFMTIAMAGVGLNTDLIQLCRTGAKPLLAGGLAMGLLACISWVLIVSLPTS